MKKIKIPKYFYYNKFDEVLQQRDTLLQKGNLSSSEEIEFDLLENEHISVLGLLFIAQFSDFLYKEKNCKCFVKTKTQK